MNESAENGGRLLRTRGGRFFTFFMLYFSEGLPQGFTAVAMATWMRRAGVSPEHIGYFTAALYLPWGWKWTMGPLVDLVFPARIGKSRFWIVTAQILMIVSLLVLIRTDVTASIELGVALVIIHNIFAALQDVAIDALACKVLLPEERGTANGLMFAGAYLGNAVGGAGVLLLSGVVGMNASMGLSPLLLACILLGISIWLKEPAATQEELQLPRERISTRLLKYVSDIRTAFFGSFRNVMILIFALLPGGAMALSLALQSSLAVELGLNDGEIGRLGLISAILSAVGCVAGGALSDRFGRRLTIGIYMASTAIPTIALGLYMSRAEWILPVAIDAPGRMVPPGWLIQAYWVTSLVYSFLQGLLYGTRTALFMDVCNPAVAATQFTAYMSILNLVTAYSAAWQGRVISGWGYPAALFIDAAFGCVCVIVLPFLKPEQAKEK